MHDTRWYDMIHDTSYLPSSSSSSTRKLLYRWSWWRHRGHPVVTRDPQATDHHCPHIVCVCVGGGGGGGMTRHNTTHSPKAMMKMIPTMHLPAVSSTFFFLFNILNFHQFMTFFFCYVASKWHWQFQYSFLYLACIHVLRVVFVYNFYYMFQEVYFFL